MKKIMIIACALVVVAISATAAQKNINTRDIEHPRLLEAALDNNFDELYAADVNLGTNALAASRLTGNVAVARITNAAATVGASIGGNIPVAAISNAFQSTLQPAYAAGKFSIAATTQLVFIASGVTNVIDADITTP
jgi:hypothetical protein